MTRGALVPFPKGNRRPPPPRNVSSAQRPQYARRFNRALVYRCVWENDGISRSELARLTGRSAPVVTDIVAELIEASLIYEAGPRSSTGGRPSTALQVRAAAWNVLAIDIARRRTTLALTDLKGGIQYEATAPTSHAVDPGANLRWLIEVIGDFLGKHKASRRLLGISIGAPGPLYSDTGEILEVTNFGDWHDLALRGVTGAFCLLLGEMVDSGSPLLDDLIRTA